jgi:hypothetical protein
MARELNDKDKEILKKLIPEYEEMTRSGIDLDYLNILPPVANHHSHGLADFQSRLKNLSVQDLDYLADQVIDGVESLDCLMPDYADAFINLVDMRVSKDKAGQARKAFESGGGCDI